eukprot:PITA_21000
MEVKIQEEDKAITLLCSLPESWDHFVTSISFSSADSLKFESVMGALLSKEVRRKSNTETAASESMVARGRSKERGEKPRGTSRSKSKGKKCKEKCWNCNKVGHLKKDCWKRKASENLKNEVNQVDSGIIDEVLSTKELCMIDETSPECNISQGVDSWLLDSGASHHVCPHRNWFTSYENVNGSSMFMGNNMSCQTVGMGDIRIKMYDNTVRTLTSVRHVPDLKKKLISLGVLDSDGYKFTGQDGVLKVFKGALVVMKAKKVGNLYRLKGSTQIGEAAVASEEEEAGTRLWHQRLGHMSEKGLQILMKHKSLPGLKSLNLDFCKHCVYGKQCKQKFKVGKHNSKDVLDYIHSDLWGPSPVMSYGGALYFLTFIDDYSRKVWIYMLKRKADVLNVFKQFKVMVEKRTGKSIKYLRTDNGGEFTSGEFEQYCKDEGIVRHKTVVYTPQQNGVAERMNQNLMERSRSMISNANLQKELWAEAVSTACYLVNKSHSVVIDCKIPEEVWTGQSCDYSHLRIFGCDAYSLIPKNQRSKLDPKVKMLCLYWLEARIFGDSEKEGETSGEKGAEDTKEAVEASEPVQQPVSLRRSTRERKIPKRYEDSASSFSLITNDGEPSCYQEAVDDTDSEKWKVAMEEEMDSLAKNNTWDLVELPEGRSVVGCRWVFKLKRKVYGSIERYKARLVAKGYSQVEGIDFHDIFSPVVKLVSIRTVLALTVLLNLELEQLDVKTNFLHGDLNEEIYMEQLEGFVRGRSRRLVCKLRKSLYGLRQSPRQWYKKFDSFMVSQNFVRSEYDHCVYFKIFNGIFIILALYVDDMLIASNNMEEINRLKAQLSRTFDMKDLGAAKHILGMEIHRDRKNGKLWLSQQKYVEKVLENFSMNNVKPVNIPLASNLKLSSVLSPRDDEEKQYMSHVPYANAVGNLMYVMVSTRPYISHAVGVVSRFMANPGKEHWQAMKWVLRYLRGTSERCIVFNGSEGSVCRYVDDDYVGDLDKRRSTTGYVFTLAGGAISWMSKLQETIALSTTETEYIAASDASKETIWLKGLLDEIGRKQEKVDVLCDSQSAIHLATNPAYHGRTKHIDVRYHFLRHVIDGGKVALKKVHTRENCAYIFTKPVTVEKLQW